MYRRVDVDNQSLAADFGNLYSAKGQDLSDIPSDSIQTAIDFADSSQMHNRKVPLYWVDDVWLPDPQSISRPRGAGFFPKMQWTPRTWSRYIMPYGDIKLDKASAHGQKVVSCGA